MSRRLSHQEALDELGRLYPHLPASRVDAMLDTLDELPDSVYSRTDWEQQSIELVAHRIGESDENLVRQVIADYAELTH